MEDPQQSGWIERPELRYVTSKDNKTKNHQAICTHRLVATSGFHGREDENFMKDPPQLDSMTVRYQVLTTLRDILDGVLRRNVLTGWHLSVELMDGKLRIL